MDLHSRRECLDAARLVLDDDFPKLSSEQREVILSAIWPVAVARAKGGDEQPIKERYTKEFERWGEDTAKLISVAFRNAYDAFAYAVYTRRMDITEAYATIAKAKKITVAELQRRADPRPAQIEATKPAPARLTAKERAAFKAFALQPENIWSETDFKRLWPDGSAGKEFQECGLSPSEFIARKFEPWLATGRLWLEDITAVQEKLSGAYSVETTEKRHPERRLPQLYVRPHRLPAGAPRAQRKLIAEMSDEEAERERERSKINTRNYRARKKVAEPA